MDDTHGRGDIHNSKGVYTLYRRYLVHPIRPVAIEWELCAVSVHELQRPSRRRTNTLQAQRHKQRKVGSYDKTNCDPDPKTELPAGKYSPEEQQQ